MTYTKQATNLTWPWTAIQQAAGFLRFAFEPADAPAEALTPTTLVDLSGALSRALGADLDDPRVAAVHAFANAVEAASRWLKAGHEQDQRTIRELGEQVQAERELMLETARELGSLKVREGLRRSVLCDLAELEVRHA